MKKTYAQMAIIGPEITPVEDTIVLTDIALIEICNLLKISIFLKLIKLYYIKIMHISQLNHQHFHYHRLVN